MARKRDSYPARECHRSARLATDTGGSASRIDDGREISRGNPRDPAQHGRNQRR